MMLNVNACDVREIPRPSNNDRNKISSVSEAGPSSSDAASFIALVTASNLQEDTLYLPQDCTSSIGLNRKCCKIVLTDGGDRSWELDLRFNKSSDSFYITRGWRHFCDEIGKKVGSLFTFELMIKGETPLLSFRPSESIINYTTSANQERFVTLKVNNDSLRHRRLYIPLRFLRNNGLEEPRMVTLLGKDGTRTLANLLRESSGRMSLGKGWIEFSKANDLKVGEHFTLELIWHNTTPILNLSNTTSISAIKQHRGKESVSTESSNGKVPEKEKNIEEDINSSSLIENRIVILTLAPEHVKTCMLYLPSEFMKANGIDKLGKIILLGINEMEWWWGYLLSKAGIVAVGSDWRYFCEANGVNIGDSFRIEFMYKHNTTPVLKFGPNSRE